MTPEDSRVSGDTLARREAAAQIEKLRGRVAELEDALTDSAGWWDTEVPDAERAEYDAFRQRVTRLLADGGATSARIEKLRNLLREGLPDSHPSSLPWREGVEEWQSRVAGALAEPDTTGWAHGSQGATHNRLTTAELDRAAHHDEEQRPPEAPVTMSGFGPGDPFVSMSQENFQAILEAARREGAEQALDQMARLLYTEVIQAYDLTPKWDEQSENVRNQWREKVRGALLSEPVPPPEPTNDHPNEHPQDQWVGFPHLEVGPVPPEPETPQKETR